MKVDKMKKLIFISILFIIVFSCAKKNDFQKKDDTNSSNARISFTEIEYNFGIIKKKRILKHKYVFKNIGSDVLRIFKVASG
jgi:hypothetical protein